MDSVRMYELVFVLPHQMGYFMRTVRTAHSISTVCAKCRWLL
jgi:hypothetical protein